MSRPFIKMNGLGNDFVIVPAAAEPFAPTPEQAHAIARRDGGIGCDQLIGLDRSPRADAVMRMWNVDGGEVGACGNATRCAAWLLMQATGRDQVSIETGAGILHASRAGEMRVSVDMGLPGLNWRDIPMAWESDTREVRLERHDMDLGLAGCVSMGNPHVVFFVENAEAADIDKIGPWAEHHPLFPERANAGFAQIKGEDHIRFRVWERGVGVTQACGTGACAALVAAHRRGLTGRAATLEMDGGELHIEWRESDGHVLMTGPVAVEFTGRLPEYETTAKP